MRQYRVLGDRGQPTALIGHLRAESRKSNSDLLARKAANSESDISMDEIVKAANDGDRAVRNSLELVGQTVGRRVGRPLLGMFWTLD